MLGLPPSTRVYYATEPVDMRNGIDGLRAKVEQALRKDPYEGHLFVFVGKSRDNVKILPRTVSSGPLSRGTSATASTSHSCLRPTRSGETPQQVLGGTEGTLLVDSYSGYDSVAEVSSRKRPACHAHLRRYFHEALVTAPVAQETIDLVLELYRVEHDAKEQRIVGTAAHLSLRRERSGPARERLKSWLEDQKTHHPPKSPIGIAIRYGLGHWNELGRFLTDARIPLDNKASERALRRVAERTNRARKPKC